MRIETYTAPRSAGGGNEDLALAGDRWALVLDGASAYPGVDVQCVHTVSWVTGRLGAHLTAGLASRPGDTLAALLRDAIASTVADHGPQCDTTHPLALGATVAMMRLRAGLAEWLVLGDAAAVVERTDGQVDAVTDDRVEQLPDPPVTDGEVRTYDPSYVARWRNRPGGFWLASTAPEAADHALTGVLPATQVRRVLLLTDGVTRLVDRYGYAWRDLMAIAARSEGLRALVDSVRAAEHADPQPRRWRGKRHDDATAALVDVAEDQPREGGYVAESASRPEPQPVVAAIVTSDRGVLVGKRNDGKPPWTFIAGEIEPGESPTDAVVREVKEETGLTVRAAEREIGRRVHPKTGRTMIYLACQPVGKLDAVVGDEDELAEVRWVSLAEAEQLLPGLFEPVHRHLAAELGGAPGASKRHGTRNNR